MNTSFFLSGANQKRCPVLPDILLLVIAGVLYKEIVTEIHCVKFFPVDT